MKLIQLNVFFFLSMIFSHSFSMNTDSTDTKEKLAELIKSSHPTVFQRHVTEKNNERCYHTLNLDSSILTVKRIPNLLHDTNTEGELVVTEKDHIYLRPTANHSFHIRIPNFCLSQIPNEQKPIHDPKNEYSTRKIHPNNDSLLVVLHDNQQHLIAKVNVLSRLLLASDKKASPRTPSNTFLDKTAQKTDSQTPKSMEPAPSSTFISRILANRRFVILGVSGAAALLLAYLALYSR